MRLAGANSDARATGLEELPGKSNYFLGNDPRNWRTNVPHYAKVRYESIYPGVDLVYYGNQHRLEYDFVVAAGADPRAITLQIETRNPRLETEPSQIQNLRSKIDSNGDLVISIAGGEVRFHKPVVYQLAPNPESRTPNPEKRFLDGRYVLLANNRVGFEIASYDASKPLIIDPILTYSTYLGGNQADYGAGIAVDSSGNAYITGHTFSTDFPVAPPSQPKPGMADVFVTKLNADGSALVYSTLLGGSGNDFGRGIAIDSIGNAYVTGRTGSADFPTANAFKATCPMCGEQTPDAFVAKLDPLGSTLAYSTYLGGPEATIGKADEGNAIAVDSSSGEAFVTGTTESSDFPLTAGAYRVTFAGANEAFVTKLESSGSELAYSTFLGGGTSDFGEGIAIDSAGNAYVAGSTTSTNFPVKPPTAFQPTNKGNTDAYVAKLDPTQSGEASLVYSTFLGGSGQDKGKSIAVDPAGVAYVTGFTDSADLPTANASQGTKGGGSDAFVTTLNSEGTALVYSTYLGGSDADKGRGIATDSSGNAFVAGFTLSTDFPTWNPIYGTLAGGQDAFVAKINPAGSMVYATYLGGVANEEDKDGAFIAVDPSANAYVTGDTVSSDFPTAGNPYQDTCASCGVPRADAFVAQIVSVPAPVVTLSPSGLTFGSQGVGTPSPPQAVTLTNRGDEALAIDGIAITGTHPGDFAVESHNCPLYPSTLAPGRQCTINVTFNPTTTGLKGADLTITDDASDSPQKVPLTGEAITGAWIALSPPSLTFATQPVGTTSAPQTVTLINPGNATLTVTFSVSGDFGQSNDCAGSVVPNDSCTISVTFTPTTAGPRTGKVRVEGNAANSPREIELTGTGITPDFSISATPNSQTKNAGQSATYAVMLSPIGGFDKDISLTCSGAPPAGSCTVSPTSVKLDGTNDGTATLTVKTKKRSMVVPGWRLKMAPPTDGVPWMVWLLAAFALGALALAGRQRAWPNRLPLFAAMALSALLWAACGGGAGGDGGGTLGTPAGTYTITVTGTSGSLSHITTVTLQVMVI